MFGMCAGECLPQRSSLIEDGPRLLELLSVFIM